PQLAAQPASLPSGEARWGAFHAAEELFEEAIDLAISENDATGAFGVAEAARARTLIESYSRSPSLDYRTLPAGTTVVEYAALPSRLVIFTADRSGIKALSNECDVRTLVGEVDALSRSLRS